jgi:hypothetical protein
MLMFPLGTVALDFWQKNVGSCPITSNSAVQEVIARTDIRKIFFVQLRTTQHMIATSSKSQSRF